jgi:hypothetical protein
VATARGAGGQVMADRNTMSGTLHTETPTTRAASHGTPFVCYLDTIQV